MSSRLAHRSAAIARSSTSTPRLTNLFTAFARRTSSGIVTTASSPQPRSTTPQPLEPSYTVNNMFRSASETHKQTLAKSLFPSSSPEQSRAIGAQKSLSQQSFRPRSAGTINGPAHALESNASFVNSRNSLPGHVANAYARPTGRLSKVVNKDAFETARTAPSSLGSEASDPYGSMTSNAPTFYDDNEFDSDIDLDGPGGTDSLPLPPFKVPQVSNQKQISQQRQIHTLPQPKPIIMPSPLYPTIPPLDAPKATPENVPESSAEVFVRPSQWPTSPAAHHQPIVYPNLRRSAADAELKMDRDLFEANQIAPRKAKRARSIPWAKREAEEESAEESDKAAPWNQPASHIQKARNKDRQAKAQLSMNIKASPEKKAKALNPLKQLVELSEEQKSIMALVINDDNLHKRPGKSIFFTGAAGTGKSVLLRELILRMKEKYKSNPGAVAVTASTGLAAVNIKGITLHSFAGAGLCQEPVNKIIPKIRSNPKSSARWKNTKVLFIDEVSMVDAGFFNKLEEIARTIRKNPRPFGGIQLVITGDFFQLPPVEKKGPAMFSFEASSWRSCMDETILLTKVFRQKDPHFAGLLNDMRLGKISADCIKTFKSLNRPLSKADGIEATELFPLRDMVFRANFSRLQQIKEPEFVYTAHDSGTAPEKSREAMLSQFMVPKEIKLKKGAQVMLVKNLDEQLVNGSMGTVVGFTDETSFIHYKSMREELIGTQEAFDEVDKMSAMKGGKGKGARGDEEERFPLVRFVQPDGSSREMMLVRETFKQETPEGVTLVAREQVPLILSWALSIHKAQGQTLSKVKVDLTKVFEDGMSYVALSRAVSKAGLHVIGFDPTKVRANPKVKLFYEGLKDIERIQAASASKASEKKPALGKKAMPKMVVDYREDEDYDGEFFDHDYA